MKLKILKKKHTTPKPPSVDVRSSQYVFVSHCILNQGIMAQGVVRNFPCMITPVVQFCLDNQINMIQMPCPESLCASGGLGRSPHGKKWYEERGLRDTAREIAIQQVNYVTRLIDDGGTILGFIGMEFSPACAPTYLNKGRTIQRDKGIYIEELQAELKRRKLDISFIGVGQRWLKKLQRELQALID